MVLGSKPPYLFARCHSFRSFFLKSSLTIFHDSEKLIIDLDANLISSLLAVIFWKDLRQAGIPSQFIDDSNNEILVATSTATGQPAGCNIAITNNVQLNFCGILF